MTPRRGWLLRFVLALIDGGRWLAPASRRREWRRQWRADILHESQWLARHRTASARAPVSSAAPPARFAMPSGCAFTSGAWK